MSSTAPARMHENPPPSCTISNIRGWWICLLITCLVYGIPVFVGSSWLPTPNFPHRTDGTRQPAFHAGYDTFSFRYFDLPYREMARQSIANGELPLWNPHSWLGVPLIAQYQNQPFSPLEWLDWLGGNRWWNITLLLRIALAGFGTFLFVRRFTRDDLTGIIAGAIYILSAYFVGFQSVAAFINGAVLLPWLFLAIDWAFSGATFRSATTLAGAVFGLAAVSGQPQIAILNFTAVAAFAVFAMIAARNHAERGRGLVILMGGALIATAVAAPQLAAFHEGLHHGYTIHTPGAYAGGSTTQLNLVLPLMPLLLGPMMSPWLGSLFPSQVNHEGFPLLLGAALIVAFGLGFLGIFSRDPGATRQHRLYVLCFALIIGAILTVIISGTLGFANLWTLPIANQINLPRYSTPLISLLVAIIAATGLRRVAVRPGWQLVTALFFVSSAIGMLHYLARDVLAAPLETTNAPLRALSLLMAELSAWGSLAAIGLIVFLRKGRTPICTAVACGMVIVAELSLCVRYGFDLKFETWRLLSWAALIAAAFAWAWQARKTTGVALAISSLTLFILGWSAPRFLEKSRNPFLESDSRVQFLQKALGPGSAGGRVVTSQWLMTPNTLAVFDVAHLNGINPLQPILAANWFKAALANKSVNYTLPVSWYGMVDDPTWPGWKDYADSRLLYNFMGVRFLIESSKRELTALDLPATRLVLDTPQYRIIEDLRAWPRVFLAEGALVATPGASDPTAALEARAQMQFPTLTVNAAPETISALNGGSAGLKITPVQQAIFNRTTVHVTASSPHPALLVLTDVNYPGWRVWVNGEEKSILTVQGIVRGVALPTGNHQVEFRYQPAWLWWSLSTATLGWLVILISLIAEFLLLRKNSSQNHPVSD